MNCTLKLLSISRKGEGTYFKHNTNIFFRFYFQKLDSVYKEKCRCLLLENRKAFFEIQIARPFLFTTKPWFYEERFSCDTPVYTRVSRSPERGTSGRYGRVHVSALRALHVTRHLGIRMRPFARILSSRSSASVQSTFLERYKLLRLSYALPMTQAVGHTEFTCNHMRLRSNLSHISKIKILKLYRAVVFLRCN